MRSVDAESAKIGRLQTTNRITGSRRWYALAAVLTTMFFASLDQTVVSTAMPVIIGELKGFDIYAWVFTAYMIATAVTVPIYGKLSDVYGRKPFYAFGLVVFMLGSALSGQAHTMLELVLFRGLQGIGAGAMMSMPQATVGDIFTPRERGRWMGVISMVFGLSSIIGPFLGGWITDNLGWRWVFYINLPVGALALAGIMYALPRVRVERQVKLDWLGSTLLVAGLIPMLLGFTWAGSEYAWTSRTILGLFGFSFMMLALFVAVESRAVEPVMPVSLFKVPIFATTTLMALLLSVSMFGLLLFLPLFVQGVLQLSAATSGAVMTPMMLSFVVASLITGQIMTRTGRYKAVALVAATEMCFGFYLFTTLDAQSDWGTVVRDMVVAGIGIGALMPIISLSVQNAFPYRVLGTVSAAQQFVRTLGGVVAAPILGAALSNSFSSGLQSNMPAPLRAVMASLSPALQDKLMNPQSLTSAHTQAVLRAQFDTFGDLGDALYLQFIAAVHNALAAGIEQLFVIGLLFALATLVVVFFLPEVPLRHDEFFEEAEEDRRAA